MIGRTRQVAVRWAVAGAACALATAPAVAQPAGEATDVPAHRLAGQHIVWSFPGRTPPGWLVAGIRRGDVGAVLLFASNGTDPAAVRRLVDRLQAVPRPVLDPPLLVMSDHEGGPVRRLDAPPTRGARDLAGLPVTASLAAGRQAGAALCAAGVNVDLAPVVDLARPGSVIARQGRSFGRGPDAVARRAVAFATGLAEYGVGAAPKHFPGLGAATETTDDVPVTIGLSRAELRRADLRPYRALVRHRVPLVMMSTAVFPAFSSRPAALAPELVTGELKGRLGFGGIVVADALDTPALAVVGSHGTVARQAAAAGVDLMPFVSPQAARAAQASLAAALNTGQLDRAASRASLERVLSYRRTLALAPPGIRSSAVARACPTG